MQLVIKHGDNVLKEHLDSKANQSKYSHRKYFYSSKKNPGYYDRRCKVFSLLADETTDSSGVEQLSVVVRYVDGESSVQERFLCFEKVVDMSSKGLADA